MKFKLSNPNWKIAHVLVNITLTLLIITATIVRLHSLEEATFLILYAILLQLVFMKIENH